MRRLLSEETTPLLLFLVGAAASVGLLMLFAYAPDMRSAGSAGNDALSRSAIGYAGLDRLLQLSGMATELDRGVAAGQSARPSLTILTPPVLGASAADWRDYQEEGAVLVILPKWIALPMPLHNDWVMKAGAYSPVLLSRLMAPIARLSVMQWPGDRNNAALEAAPPLAGLPPMLPAALQQLQTFGAGAGTPLLRLTVSDGMRRPQPRHASLLLQIRGGDKPIYVLSEPDLMNNQGLADQTTAKAAIAIIRSLRRGNGPVRLDLTLNGLGRQRNLFQALFEPPLRGATIAAFLAALLMGLHALARFGAPLRAAAPYARGKKALADNTAALVRIMGREGAMALRYVQSARDLALARLGARRRSPPEQGALIAAMEGVTGGTEYDQLVAAAAAARTGSDLLRVAALAHAWRRRISGEHQ
jgi:hypothetical protein